MTNEWTISNPSPTSLVIHEQGQTFVTFTRDGQIIVGDQFTPDEAGRQAINAMQYQLHFIIQKARNEALEEAAKVADSMTLAKSTTSWGQGADSAATAIATAIRAFKTGE